MAAEHTLGLLRGDGIGPEIVDATVALMDAGVAAAGAAPIDWVELPLGLAAIDEFGSPTPQATLETLDTLEAWVLGPHDSASYPEPYRSALNPSGVIRKRFGLYANIRPVRAFLRGRPIVPGTDLVIVRENTEGFYADRNMFAGAGEIMPTSDVALMIGVITRAGTERIARAAFELARQRRRHLTIVHKANVLKLTTGLFRAVCREIAEEYPEVTVDDFHIDAMTVHLLRRADQFDVIVTENMFGDILSDLAGEIGGSLGIAPSLNHSAVQGMAQAAHGSAPDIAGTGRANPVAMMQSGAMLLDWLGIRHRDEALREAGRRVIEAVERTVAEGVATPDLGGTATTDEFTTAAVQAIS